MSQVLVVSGWLEGWVQIRSEFGDEFRIGVVKVETVCLNAESAQTCSEGVVIQCFIAAIGK